MNRRSAPPLRLKILLLSPLFLLAGCDIIRWPHIWGPNEVPPQVVDQPRAVQAARSADVQKESWPRLGDVPSKPGNFTSQALIDATKDEMIHDREQSQADRAAYEASGAAQTAGQAP